MDEAIKLTLPARFSQVVQKFGTRNSLSLFIDRSYLFGFLH